MRITFDTGMLIALERRKYRARQVVDAIASRGLVPVVPSVVVIEWWRRRTDVREEILAMVTVEDTAEILCRTSGEALAQVRGATLVDAVVMASAALGGGGVVYTSDAADLRMLQRHFPSVNVIEI